jgi:hypothetical protein
MSAEQNKPLDPSKPNDAIAILERVTANLAGTRSEHVAIITALNTLQEAITPPAPPPPPEVVPATED